MASFTDLFKKAHGAFASLRGGHNYFLGKDGEIVYSKNNVCVHEDIANAASTSSEDEVTHTPGYLTIHCLNDEQLGVTLVLQWLPNKTLEKNPASIRCVSPRSKENGEKRLDKTPDENGYESKKLESEEDEVGSLTSPEEGASRASTDICVELNGDLITVTAGSPKRPDTLEEEGGFGLGVPSINVIPNTPIDARTMDDYAGSALANDARSESSGSTSGADEFSDKEDRAASSSCDESDGEEPKISAKGIESYRQSCASLMTTPEQFALDRNLILPNTSRSDDGTSSIALSKERVVFQQKPNTSLFSVNLGKMRSMRLFYSNREHTSGQLVIATVDSHYKILHFHFGGLDKLAQLFEQWNAVKAKSLNNDSPSPIPDRYLMICDPAVRRSEQDPEDGLYDRVSWDLWKSYTNKDGTIDDSFTIRKAVYFASMDPSLRKEIWPFLLHMYPWNSTFEQRDAIRNDLFLEYQKIKKKRMRKMNSASKNNFLNIESAIWKDVVRTDRRNSFYAGDDNPNLNVMKDILMNYAAMYPEINYIQGMSDLLAPLLLTLQNEADAYWCFVGLMQQTLFCCAPNSENNMMEINLEYLRELLKLFVPDFFIYLQSLGGDALQMMFVHRWILLFFKREFPEPLHIWEACWSRYRTSFFHLFICVSIVSIYGSDVLAQKLPHDEILLYFASLAMHLDASVVLKKARGLLYHFHRLEKIPCTLATMFEREDSGEQWTSHVPLHNFVCTQMHGDNAPCPFAQT